MHDGGTLGGWEAQPLDTHRGRTPARPMSWENPERIGSIISLSCT